MRRSRPVRPAVVAGPAARYTPVRMHNGDELTLPDVLPGFAVQVKDFFG